MRFNPMLAAGILAGALIRPGAAGASPITSPAAAVTTDESDSLYVKAGDLYAAHKYREAIPLFERVIELDPRNANAFALLGG
jgi:tetratricopeptide (TPR) repeat protein